MKKRKRRRRRKEEKPENLVLFCFPWPIVPFFFVLVFLSVCALQALTSLRQTFNRYNRDEKLEEAIAAYKASPDAVRKLRSPIYPNVDLLIFAAAAGIGGGQAGGARGGGGRGGGQARHAGQARQTRQARQGIG
jgi:hypothetical protein